MAWLIGVLFATPPSISSRPSQWTLGSTPRDRGAGEDRLGKRTVGEPHLRSGQDVGRHHVQRDRQLLEPLAGQVFIDQGMQAAVGDHVPAHAREPEQAGERVEREDHPTPQRGPDPRQLGRLATF
jgi:hypothetical protein